ncbi:hypothetical protein LBMAG53_31420 [Planctomycetota bacterium]|nr:hypothetical protein LBMAG53_31420 [Planctomycetota bacterium]
MPTQFLWDTRPGRNVDHVVAHGMTTDLWETVYHRAARTARDKDDETITIAEGRHSRQWYRIIYTEQSDGTVVPLSIFPITGFPIERRALR